MKPRDENYLETDIHSYVIKNVIRDATTDQYIDAAAVVEDSMVRSMSWSNFVGFVATVLEIGALPEIEENTDAN